MSVEKVITGYPDYSVSFLEELRTTYGGDQVGRMEGGPLPLPDDIDPDMVGREVTASTSEETAVDASHGTEVVVIPEQRHLPTPAAAGYVALAGVRQ